MRLVWGGIAWLAVLLGATSTASAAVPRPRPLAPIAAPSWDDPIAVDLDARTGTVGVATLLIDQQVRLGEPHQELMRIVRRAVTAEGLHDLADVRVGFDPAYEQIEWHALDVIRGGVRQPRLASTPAQLIQQEEDLSGRIYNGRQVYVFFLEDLRVGDAIDLRYTRVGLNPALGGRYSDRVRFAWSVPVGMVRLRVLAPADRRLRARVTASSIVEASADRDGWRDERWSVRAGPPHHPDDREPAWYDDTPAVEVSEEDSWDSVRARFLPTYQERLSAPASPELAAAIAQLRAANATDEARLLAAVRWVQREVRYFGVELGPGSLIPSPPSTVLSRRFGDCKDKSVLLVALLRGLGLEAAPALANTQRRRALDDALPSPYAFNHVIVRSVVGGVERWHDATDTGQRGELAILGPPPFERALVLSADAHGLANIPRATEAALYEVEERYVVGRDERAQLTVRTRATQRHAERLRNALAEERESWERDAIQYYARRDPSVTRAAPLQVKDDEAGDAIEVVESYTLDRFWKNGRRTLYSDGVAGLLTRPDVVQRHGPLSLPHPELRRAIVIVERPEVWALEPGPQRVDGVGFTLTQVDEIAHNWLRTTTEYRSKVDHLSPEEVPNYVADLERAWKFTEWTLRDDPPPRATRWVTLLPLAVVIGMAVVGLLINRRARAPRRRPPRSRNEAGESAAIALAAAPTDAELRRRACAGCKARGRWRGAGEDTARLGERRLRVLKLECEACGRALSLFVDAEAPAERAR